MAGRVWILCPFLYLCNGIFVVKNVLIILICVVGLVAHANASVIGYRDSSAVKKYHESAQAACEYHASLEAAAGNPYDTCLEVFNITSSQFTYRLSNSSGSYITKYGTVLELCTTPPETVFDWVSQMCVEPVSCPTGDVKMLGDNSGGLPTTACENECQYQRGGGVGVQLVSGQWTAQFISTGQSCTPSDPEESPANSDCIADAQGNELCFDQQQTNCGTFNGKQVCLDSLPASGECTIIAGKGYICDAGESAPTLPDGGVAPEVGTMSEEESPGSGNYNDWKIYDNGIPGDTPVDPGEPSSEEGDDEPLKIDEDGVPEGSDDMYNQQLNDAFDSYGAGIGLESGVGAPIFNPGLPSSGSCAQITMNILGRSYSFPGANGCIWLAKWRDIAGWFFYIVTAIELFKIATRRPA